MGALWRFLVLFSASLLGKVFFRTFNKLEIIGEIPGTGSGPIIYYANHRHWLDPAAILFGCFMRPGSFFLAKNPAIWTAAWSRYLRPWYVHWIVEPGRVLEYLEHTQAGFETWVRSCDAVIKREGQLLIFPEGDWRRGAAYDDLGVFGDFLAWLIRQNTNVQVVPIGIIGIEALWPRTFCRFGKRVKIVFGKPILVSVWGDRSRTEITADLKLRLQAIIQAHQQ